MLMQERTQLNPWVDYLEAIPAELQALDRWCCWQGTPETLLNGRDGFPAQPDDPASWSGFADALNYLRWHLVGKPEPCGLSFVLDGSGIVTIDLLECVRADLRAIKEHALEGRWMVLESWCGPVAIRNPAVALCMSLHSYTECVPHAAGPGFGSLRVFVKGTLPDGARCGNVLCRATGTVPVSGLIIHPWPSWQAPAATGVRDMGGGLEHWWQGLEEGTKNHYVGCNLRKETDWVG